MKKVIYEVSRHFTKGNLEGLNHQCHMSFVSSTRAHAWKSGVKRNIKAGLLDYDLVGFRFIGSQNI